MMITNWVNTIKTLLATKKIVTEASKEVKAMDGKIKSGWRTSEFWGSRMTQIAGIVAMVLAFKYDLSPDFKELVIAFGMSLVGVSDAFYSVSRGMTKKQK